MNRAQRTAHARLWPFLLIVLLAVIGGALAVRERAIEAAAALRAPGR